MNTKDWSNTFLGPPEQWPEAIRSAVALCLNATFQMAVLAGPELVYIYNDNCAHIFGDKHPWALGQRVRDVWSEAWADLEPLLQGVMESGRPRHLEDLQLVLHRAGFPEETHFTASYSPIHDATGKVIGVLVVTLETSQRLLVERRQRWLGELATWVAQHGGVPGALDMLRDLLSSNSPDLPLTALYLAEDDRAVQVFCSGLRGTGARVPKFMAWPGPGEGENANPFSSVALSGESRLFDADVILDPDDRCGALEEAPRILVAVPLMLAGHGKPRGLMVVALNPYVRSDCDYLRFVQTTVGLVATVVAGRDALEAERRRAEALEELDRSKSRFSDLRREVAEIRDDLVQVIEATNDAFVSFDRTLHIRSLNGVAEQAFGRKRQRLVGKPLLEVAPRLEGTPVLDALRKAAESQQPAYVELYHARLARWFEVRILPAPYGVLAFGADMTTHKLAEQAMLEANLRLERSVEERTRELREAHRLLTAVFDRAPGGIAITRVNGNYLRVNPAYASMLGYDGVQLAGRNLVQLVDPGDYRDASPLLGRLLSGELASCEIEMRFQRADGEVIWVLSFLSVIEEGQGMPRYLVHIAQDVTSRRRFEAERKAAQEELKSLYLRLQTVREKERTALAREVHDQLGQVLSAAKIDLRLLEDLVLAQWASLAPQEVAHELRSASGSLDRALHIVRQIATELRAPELDGQGLYAALEWHAKDFEQRTRIRVIFEVETGLPQPARATAEALLRIFQEALTNVMRHARAREVCVTIERRGERLLLHVRDDGVGIMHDKPARAGALGITGMRERAALVQGRLLVGPLKPRGTLVSALVPIGVAEPAHRIQEGGLADD